MSMKKPPKIKFTKLTSDDINNHVCWLAMTDGLYGTIEKGSERSCKMIKRFVDMFGEQDE